MSEREFNEVFAERLRYFLEKYEITQLELSKRLGVGTTSVYNWCNGIKTPRMDNIDAMRKIFHCKRSDLINDKSDCEKRTGAVPIKVLGRVAAGIPIEAVENVIDIEEISAELASTGEFFGLQIHGDSMEPKFSDGDVVIVRQQDDAESGDIVIATVNGTDATCKRLRKYRDGIELISTNPSYEPMFFSAEDIEKKPVRIIGRVVELRAKF